MNYIKVSDVFISSDVSNIDLYAVCYTEDQSNIASVQEFVFNEKGKQETKYYIVQYTEEEPDMILLQRYTSNGERENVSGNDNHVYLVSLINGETNALNETMKTVLKL